jgi:hypothetical protein
MGEPLQIVKDMELPSPCNAISVVEDSIELPGAYGSGPQRRDVLPGGESLTNVWEPRDSIMVSDSDLWDEDVPVLRRGEIFSHCAIDTSRLLPSILFSDPRPTVDHGAQALAVDELPREVSLEELRYDSLDPTPRDMSDSTANETEEPEYVFDKIVGLRKADDGTWLYRVLCYGYSSDYDTWDPAHHLPGNVVRRYHRRVGLPIGD